jgi:branched-chain amino acid transport system ATP-binding protein
LSDGVLSLAQLLGIEKSLSVTANNLSFGDQKRLEIARALAGKPKLLILDEPAGGMNPSEVKTLSETLRKIQETGITILLIEHNMKLVMGTCQKIAVLNFGELICEGSPEQVKSNARVLEAYLGYSQ